MRWLFVIATLTVAAVRLPAPPPPEPDPFAHGQPIDLHRVVPANERGILCLAQGADGRIYGGTTGRAAHFFVCDPAKGDVRSLARLSGQGSWRIIVREIAPNMSSYLFLVFILLFGGSVLTAATLDFIGLGPTEVMSLGLMLNVAVSNSALQLGMWWWFVAPGVGITAIVAALYVTNVGLDEVFNPKLRKT